ncbi:MAG: amino acid adenylation domain-containing protein, partial [Bacteroidota bacterium]
VRSLCALLTDQGTEFSNISPVEDQEHYPLSFAQRRLWITNELEQYQTAYNISQCFEINDHIYPDILRKAIYAVIEKHQVLRTAFISVDGNIRQKVIDIDQFRFDLVKESICDKEELKKIAEIELNTPFDLTEDTLFRCRLCEYSNGSSAFIFSIHHIISDGWSMKIFYKELMEFYRQISLGQADEIQGSLPIQYKDYAVWLQNLASDQSIQKQREFWHDQLSGQIPTLELPTDFTRPTKKTFKGKTEIVSFDHKLLSRLRAISQQFQCSMFITLHAAVKALLFKITGESDIIIGTPVAGRDHSSLSDQIGFYVNMIVLRSQFKGEESFAEFLNETKRDTLNAYDNQLYPFDLLVEELNVARDLSRSPLFEIMIAVDDMNDIQMGEEESLTTEIEDDSLLEVGDTETESKEEGAKYELSFNFLEREDGLDLCLNYNTDLYSDEKIKTYADCFNQIIYQIAADVDVALNDLELLSTREADRLDGYNNINPDLVDTENVVAMITKVAGLNPTHEALIGQGESLSYLELDNKSNQFANYLLEKNIGRGNLVGVLMNRSYESIISILGILKSGAAYVPIDPTYPVERQDYIINDSALSCLATNVVYKGNCNVDVINYSEINAQVELSMKVDLQDDDPAYVIYTSGTTGLAKGVVISHKSLMSYSHTFVSYFGLGVSDRIIHQANISFDISVEEIFPTLCTGAGLIIPNHQIVGTEDLLEIIDTEKVTLLSTTPMVVDELNRSTRNQVLSNLRYLISGGDYLKGENINNLVGLTAIYNTYGPTETTVCATYHPIEDIDECSIIGQSINNADIYVINDQNQIQPTGVIGEVCISGSGVALGYLNNPELTVNKFVDNPFAESGKMYKTGDLGYWLPNGKIKLVGRMDDQVKVRGYRVDPNEIESVIERHHHAEQSAVLPLLSNSKSYYLAAFYTGERNSEEEIREHLAMRLPSYMVPTVIRRLDELPKTSNGKIDQTALKVLSQHDYKVEEIKAPESTLETNLVNIWKECLEIDIIGTNQNFFEVGGNSLKALSIIKEYSQIDISMSLAEFFNNSTIRKQANFLTKSSEEAAGVIEFAEFNEDLRNLFLVPPILGSSTIYRSLALNLKQDYNCYGLQYFGFEEGQTPYQSIDEIVTAFRREIENVSKDNHITLVGYSFGAIVAFEVAKSLERKNINVTLVLIDKNVEHESIPFDELTDKDIDLLFNQQLGGWALTDSSEDLERLRTLFRQNLEIQAEYTNRGGIEGEMITIEATDGEFEAVMEEWQNHTSGKFHHHYLSGDHFTVLNEANSLNVKDIILEHSVNLHS